MDVLIFIVLMLIGIIFLSDGLFMIGRIIWTTIKKHILKEKEDDYSYFYIEDIC